VIRHALRAYPTLLRIGLSEMVAYRAEFFVWILTTNMPLVMMALWSAVAADGPVGRFGQRQFVTYFLAALIVRLLTSTWMVWELTMDVRQGRLATRLMRPLHPLLAYSAQHLAAVPLRALMVSPVVVVLFVTRGADLPLGDPLRLAVLALSLIGAWLLLFCTMALIGSLALFFDSALGLFELWLGVHFMLSGYLQPIELLPVPPWALALVRELPFFYMLGFPVEAMVGLMDRQALLPALAMQWTYVAVTGAAVVLVWRAGMRRFVAFGG
jgi:ABC-2 type transport system permease protein